MTGLIVFSDCENGGNEFSEILRFSDVVHRVDIIRIKCAAKFLDFRWNESIEVVSDEAVVKETLC